MASDTDLKQMSRRLKEYKSAHKKAYVALYDTVLEIVDDILLKELKRGGAGRQYNRGKRARHTASKPYEYPVNDRGRLAKTVRVGRNKAKFSATIRVGGIAGVAYATYLEYGAKDSSGTYRMEPRPFMAPTRLKGIPMVQEAIADSVDPSNFFF